MQEAEFLKDISLMMAQSGMPLAQPMVVKMLEKMDMPDLDQMIEQAGFITQAKQQMEMMQKRIEELEGDMQTRERELYHARVDAELAKAKSSISGEVEKIRKTGQLHEARAADMEKMHKERLDFERKLKATNSTTT
jgi:predicted  nucleic acid-binding Zn-ribbon protein